MRLILEGIDGAGKSTIRTEILKRFTARSTELGKPPKSVTPLQWADYFREAYDKNDLLSRCHVSEQVYGTLIRGKSLIDDWQAWLLTMQLRALDFQLFYISADFQTIASRILARPDASDYDKWVINHMHEMERVYINFLPMDMTTVVPNNGTIEEAMNYVLSHARPNVEPLRGIGYRNPKVFIVGEEFTRKRWDFPHARPFDSGEAAKMVYAALKDIPDIYVTNALYPDLGEVRSQVNLFHEYVVQGGAIVAIGSIAREQCRRAGLVIEAYVNHPQYWRRFHYSDRHAWATELRSIVEAFRG